MLDYTSADAKATMELNTKMEKTKLKIIRDVFFPQITHNGISTKEIFALDYPTTMGIERKDIHKAIEECIGEGLLLRGNRSLFKTREGELYAKTN